MFERLKRRFQRHRADADTPANSERATETSSGDASATPAAAEHTAESVDLASTAAPSFTEAPAAPPAPPTVWQGAASPAVAAASPPAAADTAPPPAAEQGPSSEPAPVDATPVNAAVPAALAMPDTDQAAKPDPADAAAARTAQTGAAQPGRELVMIDERRYVLSDFPEELRQLLFSLRRADELLRIHRNRVVVLNQGSKALRERVRQELALHPALAEETDAVSATAPSNQDGDGSQSSGAEPSSGNDPAASDPNADDGWQARLSDG